MSIIETQSIARCVLCGGDGSSRYINLEDRLHEVQGHWIYSLCKNCELLWLSNRPIPEHVPALYTRYYTHARPRRSVRPSTGSLQKMFGRGLLRLGIVDILSAPTYWREVWYPGRGQVRFLDVGCGNGEFAGILQSTGWEVAGVEPDKSAAAIATEYLNTEVYVGNLDAAGFGKGEFDLIRLSHVLEHLDEPVQTLASCFRLLRPGGRLIISTPNLNSLGHQHRFGVHWLHLDPPRHFFLFSPKSLDQAVRMAGFDDVRISTSARGAQMTWLTSTMIARHGKLPLEWKKMVGFVQRVEAEVIEVFEAMLSRFVPLAEDLQLVAIR